MATNQDKGAQNSVEADTNARQSKDILGEMTANWNQTLVDLLQTAEQSNELENTTRGTVQDHYVAVVENLPEQNNAMSVAVSSHGSDYHAYSTSYDSDSDSSSYFDDHHEDGVLLRDLDIERLNYLETYIAIPECETRSDNQD